MEQKREKDSWTWTTVPVIVGGGSRRGINGNGKNTMQKRPNFSSMRSNKSEVS